ncbi:MAG: DUF2800 domain-containing protein [Actinomyces sp.]|uniref:DUF2800 domain-containing protein n=1 Tax=uncultured Actinomyces sp. TaxID=249061 RepID=UPI002804CE09|nr:DUF2800 domain-containing protein [uncultured Actinomyces sp.]MDU4831131.1 DUF2800 domain-containing protein [Actinomyces sp.]
MAPETHALLSASSAHRWLNCTPSALLEAGKPDKDSTASLEGTAAHALAEWKLTEMLGRGPGARPQSAYDTLEMDEHTSAYVIHVNQLLDDHEGPSRVFIEQRLDYSKYAPDGYGTGDCVIISDGLLDIVDFKYGQGVLVEAEQNPQLKLYALGALEAFQDIYRVDQVRATIFQPRRDNTVRVEYSRSELVEWGEQTVKPAAALAAKGKGEFKAGPWCQFCKLAPTCRARAEENLKLARLEFKPGPELSDEEVAQVLRQLPDLTKWAAEVEKYATQAAVSQGKQWEGMKLVAGRSVRKYADENQVIQAARDAGYKDGDIFEQKLITLTRMEKLVGKKQFTQIFDGLVVKPEGKPTLVPMSDRRKALDLAAPEQEFENLDK